MDLPPGFKTQEELEKAMSSLLAHREKVRAQLRQKKYPYEIFVKEPRQSWRSLHGFRGREDIRDYLESHKHSGTLPWDSVLWLKGPGVSSFFYSSMMGLEVIPKKRVSEYVSRGEALSYLRKTLKNPDLLRAFACESLTKNRVKNLRAGRPVKWGYPGMGEEFSMTLSQAEEYEKRSEDIEVPTMGPHEGLLEEVGEELEEVSSLSDLGALVDDRCEDLYQEANEEWRRANLELVEDIKKEVD